MGAACAGLEGHVPGEATDQRVSAPGTGVPDVVASDHLGDVPVGLLHLQDPREDLPQGVHVRPRAHERQLGSGVGQDLGGDRVALGVVGVEQVRRGPAVQGGGELPAEVERVLQPQVESLAACGRVDEVSRLERVPGRSADR